MTKRYKTPPLVMTAAKAAYLWRWLNEHKNRDKIGYSGYNGQTTFYFDEAEDYFMFMMEYYD
jgi:hypothetical protein